MVDYFIKIKTLGAENYTYMEQQINPLPASVKGSMKRTPFILTT